MNKTTKAKLNHLLKSLPITKEQKDAILDITEECSAGGVLNLL